MQRIEKDNVTEHLTMPTCGSTKVSAPSASETACVCPNGKILNNNAVPGTATKAAVAATKWWCTSS